VVGREVREEVRKRPVASGRRPPEVREYVLRRRGTVVRFGACLDATGFCTATDSGSAVDFRDAALLAEVIR